MMHVVIFVTALYVAASPGGATVSGSASAIVQKPNFSGTWELDRDASQINAAEGLAGLGEGGAPATLHVTHAANGALILSSRVNAAQARAYQVGADSEVPAAEGTTMIVTSRWEGDVLVTEGSKELAPDGPSLGVREVLSLSADGQTLTLVVTTATNPGGESTNTLVYRKLRRAPGTAAEPAAGAGPRRRIPLSTG